MHIFFADLDKEKMERIAPLLEHVAPLFEQLGAAVPIWFEPTRANVRASVHISVNGVHIGVAPKQRVTVADIAHEVMHLIMDLEGYPTLGGSQNAGVWASALLDGEVDRRVAAAGYDPTTDSDLDYRRIARTKPKRVDQEQLLGFYISWHTTATRCSDIRQGWRARIRVLHPGVAKLGDAIIKSIGREGVMQSAAGASLAMSDASEQLRAAGIFNGTLEFAGPEFEGLRSTCWPQRLAKLIASVSTQESA